MKKILYITILFIPFLSLSQNPIKDESYLNESFIEFKVKLEYSIQKKDKHLLKELLYDKVLDCWDSYNCAGFDGCDKNDFINTFFDDSLSLHWNMIRQVVRYGFARNSDTVNYKHITEPRDSLIFYAPSYSTIKVGNVMILAENLNVRKEPNTNSKILKTISYKIYPCYTDDTGFVTIYNEDWIKLKFDDGISGFVSWKFTSEKINRNLKIAKINDEWKIIEYFCELNI